jgi:hypothetical protein
MTNGDLWLCCNRNFARTGCKSLGTDFEFVAYWNITCDLTVAAALS